MKALLLFHLKVGVRVAVRSFAPLFCLILAAIMLQMDPAAAVTALALSVFAVQPALPEILPIVALAFILPVWSAPRLATGLNGWMRHLAISAGGNRRGLAFALAVVQMPLAVSLAVLAIVARLHGLGIQHPALRWFLVLISAAFAALPVKRRWLTVPLCVCASLLALFGALWMSPAIITLLFAADALSGPILRPQRRRPSRAAGSLFSFRIAWRALGWRLPAAYIPALTALGARILFAANNALPAPLAAGAARMGGATAVVLLVSALAGRLAVRRPVWPLARSFPWSSSRRIAADALFLSLHALPLVILVAVEAPLAAAGVLLLVPYLSLRASGYIRTIPERRSGAGRFMAEGLFAAAILALLPWTFLLWPVAALPAFRAARGAELRQKVTRWMELHYIAAGDSLSWSDG